MKRTLIITILTVVTIPPLARGQATPQEANRNGKAEQEVRRLDGERVGAMLRGDTGALARICSDDLVYTHSGGTVETKAQWLESLKSGALRYEAFDRDDVRARVYGDTAVVTGRSKVKVRSGVQGGNFQIRYLAVYARRQGRWQFVSWQSTRIAQQ